VNPVGQTGIIKTGGFVIDIPARDSDQGVGTGHRSASVLGATGCLTIKCSEDSCMTDGKSKGHFKSFAWKKNQQWSLLVPQIQSISSFVVVFFLSSVLSVQFMLIIMSYNIFLFFVYNINL